MAKYEVPEVKVKIADFETYGVWSRNMEKVRVGFGRTATGAFIGMGLAGFNHIGATTAEIVSPETAQERAEELCYNENDAAGDLRISGDDVYMIAAPREAWTECVEAQMANYTPVADQIATRDASVDLATTLLIAAATIYAGLTAAYFPATRRDNALRRIQYGGGTEAAPIYGHTYFKSEIFDRDNHSRGGDGRKELVAKFANHQERSDEYLGEQQIINALKDLDAPRFGGTFKQQWKPEHLDAFVRNRIEAINALRTVKAQIATSGNEKLIDNYRGFDLYEHPDHKTLRPLIQLPHGKVTAKTSITALLLDTNGLPPVATAPAPQ